jgi:L-amino acid N-acyltransferase YncA
MLFSQSPDLKADKESIIDLTRKIFGEAEIVNPDFFDWQYLKNPEGQAIVITAKDNENNNSVIGVESILPMALIVNQKIVKASLSCNSYVHTNYRKKGIFSKLISTLFDESAKKEILCIYGVANDNSFNSFVNKGSHEIVDLPILFKPLRLSRFFPFPLNILIHLFDNIWKVNKKSNPNVVDFHEDFDKSFETLVEKASKRVPIIQRRTKEFLNWRYRNHPTREYKTFVLRENSVLEGYIIVRKTQVNGKLIGVIVDLLIDSNKNKGIQDLLMYALEYFWNSGVSVVITTCGPSTLEYKMLRQNGFRIAPKFMKPQSSHFIIIYSKSNENDSEQLKKYDNWFFSFGDYDVF